MQDEINANKAQVALLAERAKAYAAEVDEEVAAEAKANDAVRALLAKRAADHQAYLDKVEDTIRGIGFILEDISAAAQAFGIAADSAFSRALGSAQNLANAGADIFKAFTSGNLLDKIGAIARGIGVVAGAIGGLFRNKEIEKVNDLRDAFFKAQGGFEAFSKKMAAASTEDWAKKIFNAKTVEEFNALVAESQGLLAAQGESEQALAEAAERYGIAATDLGPLQAQKELDKQAQQLFQDYTLLNGVGMEHNLLLEKMGPAMSKYVDTAVASGSSIPEALRKQIDELYKAGKLVHENGEAYTEAEYNGLSFSQTMSEMFTTLIEKLDKYLSLLTGIPQNVNTRVNTEYTSTGDGQHGQQGGPENQDVPQYALGTPYVPRTGIAYVHRGEAIIPAAQNSRSGATTSNADVVAAVEALSRTITTTLPKAILHAVQTA